MNALAPRPMAVRIPAQRRSVRVQAATKVTEQGPDMWNTTYYPKAIDTANNVKPWYVINAEGQTLGRLASLAASYIRGKHLPTYHPASDMGSYVVILNAEKVEVTGTKFDDKYYFNHTQNKRSGAGRIGGYRIEYFKDLQQRRPEKIIEEAVYGMLPKGRLGKSIRVQHLKVVKGTNHKFGAQTPIDITHKISDPSL